MIKGNEIKIHQHGGLLTQFIIGRIVAPSSIIELRERFLKDAVIAQLRKY